MRRGAALAGFAAALVLATPASAVDRDFHGHLDAHPTLHISFTVVRHGGVDKRVKDVVVRVPVDCDAGHQRLTAMSSGSATIGADGHFALREPQLRFSGAVDGAHASGHLRVHGSFSGSSQNCESGVLAWTASH